MTLRADFSGEQREAVKGSSLLWSVSKSTVGNKIRNQHHRKPLVHKTDSLLRLLAGSSM